MLCLLLVMRTWPLGKNVHEKLRFYIFFKHQITANVKFGDRLSRSPCQAIISLLCLNLFAQILNRFMQVTIKALGHRKRNVNQIVRKIIPRHLVNFLLIFWSWWPKWVWNLDGGRNLSIAAMCWMISAYVRGGETSWPEGRIRHCLATGGPDAVRRTWSMQK